MENTPTSMDEHIRATFDMLVERISNLEELARQQRDAMVYDECCKYGRLNNKTLGLPFRISRQEPTYSQNTYTSPSPSMGAILISFGGIGCLCHKSRPSAVEVVLGEDFAEKMFASDDMIHPSEVGWMDSRFSCVDHAAIQKHLDSIFEGSAFRATFYTYEACYLFSITSLDGDKDLSVLMEQIPKLLNIIHETRCITDVFVEELPSEIDELVQTFQKAENLPEGAREAHVRKLDVSRLLILRKLKEHPLWGTLPEF